MLETDQFEGEGSRPGWLGKLGHSISAKLMLSILLAGLAIFALLGYLSIRLHRKNLEAAALLSAERQSEVVRRSASHYMLHNDRNGLYELMTNIADQPGVVRLRILNSEGVISYSTQPTEVGSTVNKDAEACYGCHEQSKPLTLLKRSDRFLIYRADGARVLSVITPIENKPECSNAACHAHPASVQILGVMRIPPRTEDSHAPGTTSLSHMGAHYDSCTGRVVRRELLRLCALGLVRPAPAEQVSLMLGGHGAESHHAITKKIRKNTTAITRTGIPHLCSKCGTRLPAGCDDCHLCM